MGVHCLCPIVFLVSSWIYERGEQRLGAANPYFFLHCSPGCQLEWLKTEAGGNCSQLPFSPVWSSVEWEVLSAGVLSAQTRSIHSRVLWGEFRRPGLLYSGLRGCVGGVCSGELRSAHPTAWPWLISAGSLDLWSLPGILLQGQGSQSLTPSAAHQCSLPMNESLSVFTASAGHLSRQTQRESQVGSPWLIRHESPWYDLLCTSLTPVLLGTL